MTAPAGILSDPICALRDLVCASAAFQAWVSAADAAAAKANTFLLEFDRRTAPARFCMLDFGDVKRQRRALTNGVQFEHAPGSTLAAYFRGDAAGADAETGILDYTNAIGAIWADMEKGAGVYASRSLAISSIELTVRPTRIIVEQRQQAGDYIESLLSVVYTRQP